MRRESPISKARLHELYWRDAKSLSEIAAIVTEMTGEPTHPPMVWKWLKRSGIQVRTRSEGTNVLIATKPGEKQRRAAIVANRDHSVHGMLTRRAILKGGKISAAKRHNESLETRMCALPGCNKSITRQRFRFLRPPERTGCCRSHAAKIGCMKVIEIPDWLKPHIR